MRLEHRANGVPHLRTLTPPPHAQSPVDVSVVIPVHDEYESLVPLLAALDAHVPAPDRRHEYVLVDDGSGDGSGPLLDRLAADRDDLVVVHLRRSFGQTAAIEAGIQASTGDVLVFLDADLQNDPADIPALLERLDEGYDVVHGWRQTRQDVFWSRRLPSRIANALIRRVTGVRVRDLGCAIRAIRRELAEELPLEGEMHRFIAVLADARGGRWCEIPVRHHARAHGRSKYGLSRTFKVAIDLVMLCWFTRWALPMTRGLVGAGLVLTGLAPVIAALPIVTGWSAPPSTGLGVAAIACFGGLQLIGLGLVAGTAASNWWRARNLRPWSIRPATAARPAGVRHAESAVGSRSIVGAPGARAA